MQLDIFFYLALDVTLWSRRTVSETVSKELLKAGGWAKVQLTRELLTLVNHYDFAPL